jgi:hypothetical protein
LTSALWSLLVNKVHLRAYRPVSTGPIRALRDVVDVSITKVAGYPGDIGRCSASAAACAGGTGADNISLRWT